MTIARYLALGAAATVIAASLSGCSPTGCGSGAPTPKQAVVGLLEAAPKAEYIEDLCAFTTHAYAADEKDLDALKVLADLTDSDDVKTIESSQMGSTITVTVTAGDSEPRELSVTSDDQRWLVSIDDLAD